MQPLLRSPIPIPEATLAVFAVNGGKPHQGLASENPAPNQEQSVCKSTVLLGMRGQAELNRIGSCSTGKERDAESGNDYFGARYYASTMGRFLSPDPSQLYFADPTNPQSLNLYSYGWNNPLTNIDPSGLDACAYDNGDGTATIWNAADGGEVDCPGDGSYITTTQQVTAVGYDSNGDLSVYGANGNLYNPDGSAYDPSQSITVNGDTGSSSYIGLQTINSPALEYAVSRPGQYSGPTNGSSYSRADICAASALLHNGTETGLDTLGAIPGEGNALKGAQLAGGVINAGIAASGNSPTNAGLAGAGVGLSLADTSGTAQITANVFGKSLKVIPFVGNLLSAYAAYGDSKEMSAYYNACMAGKN